MLRNEKGGSLIYVLLIIIVFSVLGMALMASTVSESKRTEMTESEMQAQHLALNGLTYFETAFKGYINVKNAKAESIEIERFIEQYQDWTPLGPESKPEEMQIKAKLSLKDENNIEVWSKGTVGNVEKSFKGYYKLNYELEAKPGNLIYDIPDFTDREATAINFSNSKVLGLGLGPILDLDLIRSHGTDRKFYRVPDEGVIKLGLLGLIDFSIGDGERFKTVEEKSVIATRKSGVANVGLLTFKDQELVRIHLLTYTDNNDTNVLINGGFTPISIAWKLLEYNDYRNIDFKRLAVTGNCLIQQDRDGSGVLAGRDTADSRRFTFREGLYVKRSLIIGGEQEKAGAAKNRSEYSKLMLRGDMVTMENLVITDADVTIGDHPENEAVLTEKDYFTGMYVQGDAEIKNACIRAKNDDYDLGIFAKGKITIDNNSACSTFNGLYYAENGIEIKTNGKPMTIQGGLIGKVKVDHPDQLKVIEEENLLSKVKITDVHLIHQGRTTE